jgi:hypothetical protein
MSRNTLPIRLTLVLVLAAGGGWGVRGEHDHRSRFLVVP